MPIYKTLEQELTSLFEQLKNNTENFSKLEPEIICSNPRTIGVFRLLLRKSLNEMGQLLNRSYATVSQYERGKIHSIPIGEAGKMLEAIKQRMPHDPNLSLLTGSFLEFKDKSRGGTMQALKRAEKMEPTTQERILSKYLTQMGVPFRQHVTLDTEIGPLNFDFQIKESIIVECTASKSKWKAESLGYRAIKAREKYPQMKIVALVPKSVNDGFRRRLRDFDLIIELENESSLLPLVDLLFTKKSKSDKEQRRAEFLSNSSNRTMG